MLRILRNLLIVAATAIACIAIIYFSIPTSTGMTPAEQKHFDVILVLGHPASPGGSPSPEERASVEEAVRLYREGLSQNLLFTGGAAHNRFVEAQVMAGYAESLGVPRSAIAVEGQARDTIQNAWYSYRIMQQRGWQSALVVSFPSHLRRASLIFRHYPIAWRMHAAPWPPEYGVRRKLRYWVREALFTAYLRIAGFPKSPYLPETSFAPPKL